jgi:hypothetical protein
VSDVKVRSRSVIAEKANLSAPLKYCCESKGEADKFSEYAHSPGSKQPKERVREVRERGRIFVRRSYIFNFA